jgi:protease-4
MNITRSLSASAVVLCAALATARALAPATGPASQPAHPAAKATADAKAAPVTTRASKYPTPAELVAKMQAKQKEIDALPKVGLIELSGAVVEKPSFKLLGGGGGTPLMDLTDRLIAARDDATLQAVVIVIGADFGVNAAQAGEIRDVLASFKAKGKRVFVYADAYDTDTYVMASGASDIVLLEGGELFMPGIGLETQFYKGLMDKVGVKGDYVQIGEYKGAEEPYTRTTPSEELKGNLGALADGLYAEITSEIAKARLLKLDVVEQAIDDAMIPAPSAKARGLVDHLADRDGLRALLEQELGAKKINVVANYGDEDKPEPDFSNPLSLLSSLAKKPEPTTRDTVAVLYAVGTIVDGNGGGGGIPYLSQGESIGSEDVRTAMRAIRDDDHIKAVVIRIDSPGGSALASEAMWQSVRKVAGSKPVVISVGSMAASGGYYLASSGDTIVAEPTAIVGSIGVVGGKFVLKGLYDKLGITSESFLKGRNADIYSQSSEWSERQRKMIASNMKTTYEQFTTRVMTTRKGKIVDIDKVARGRVFVAADAVKLGMVDKLGGLSDAVKLAAGKVHLKEDDYDIRSFPETNPLGGWLGNLMASTGTASPEAQAFLSVMPEAMRRSLGEQIRFMQLLERRPVVLHVPFSITVR